MGRRNILLINSILLTIYFVGSVPFYLIQGSSLDRFVIAAVLFTVLVLVHEAFILLAMIFQWVGYINQSRGWIRLANWTMLIGGIVGIILVFPIVIITPLIVINIFSKKQKMISKTVK